MDWSIFWDAASSLATVAATGLALWLAVRDNVKRIDALFVWVEVECYQPILFLCNSGKIPIPIEQISITCKGEVIFSVNSLKGNTSDKFDDFILPPGELRRLNLSTDGVSISDRYKWKNQPHRLPMRIKITIKDMRGKKYVFRQKISENQMAENEVGTVILADYRK